MVASVWYLSPWGHERLFTMISIDPSTVVGQHGIFGQTLFFPYSISEWLHDSPLGLHLLSLEGWIGWSNEDSFSAKLRIPSQIVYDNPNQRGLQVPITTMQIEAIEEARKGNYVTLSISLGGLARVLAHSTPIDIDSTPYADRIGDLLPLQSPSSFPTTMVIERERWLMILQQLSAGTRRLVELPEPRLSPDTQAWTECIRLLNEATRLYRSGNYEHTFINCRMIAEGIPQVLCNAWGLPQKTRSQSVAKWIDSITPQLVAAWSEDQKSPGMLRTMLIGTWEWTAPAPHYGSDIPLREKAAFALELCTSLLSFAGQVLQAHPEAIVSE